MAYKISQNGLNLLKDFEGCRLKAYKCVSSEKYYTIGYGHYGVDVKADARITQNEADKLLETDVQKFVDIVNNCINGYSINWMNQNKFDALVSFTFNCGKANLIKLLNEGKRTSEHVANAMLLYTKSGGKVLAGLERRRKAEYKLFKSPVVNDLETLAYEVIDGKWGNGAARRIRLTAAGYNYSLVQSKVNEILRR